MPPKKNKHTNLPPPVVTHRAAARRETHNDGTDVVSTSAGSPAVAAPKRVVPKRVVNSSGDEFVSSTANTTNTASGLTLNATTKTTDAVAPDASDTSEKSTTERHFTSHEHQCNDEDSKLSVGEFSPLVDLSDNIEDSLSEDNSNDGDYKPPASDVDDDEDDVVEFQGNRATKSLLDAVDDKFFDDDSVSTVESVKLISNASPVRRGRPKTGKKYTERTPPKGASAKQVAAYKKGRKKFYDQERRKKLKSPNKKGPEEYSGNHHPTLRTMAEVEESRLSKGQTFKSRDIQANKVRVFGQFSQILNIAGSLAGLRTKDRDPARRSCKR